MSKKIEETPEQKAYRELVEKIANQIGTLAKAVAGLLNGPLKRKALVILLAYSSNQNQYTVEKILTALEDLEKDWVNK